MLKHEKAKPAGLLRRPAQSSVPSVWTVHPHEPPGRALISLVTTTATVVADHQRAAHAVPAHVTNLVAAPTDNISVSTSTIISATTTATAPFRQHISLGALPGHMAGDVTQVADRVIWAVAS